MCEVIYLRPGSRPFVPLAISSAEPGTDPIFAVIERHRLADQRLDACPLPWESPERIRLKTEEGKAFRALLEAQPTTVAGVAAYLHYIAQQRNEGGLWAGDWDDADGVIATAARALVGVGERGGPQPAA